MKTVAWNFDTRKWDEVQSVPANTQCKYTGPEYPPHWDEPDKPEPETELVFCHADLRPEDDCGGDFHEATISVGKDKQQAFWECDECRMLMTKDELITLAAESYGHDWERQCTRVLSEEEPYYI